MLIRTKNYFFAKANPNVTRPPSAKTAPPASAIPINPSENKMIDILCFYAYQYILNMK